MKYISKQAIKLIVVLTCVFFLDSCDIPNDKLAMISQINDSIKKEFAPDKRVALYNISINNSENNLVLKGESNQFEAVNLLKQKLSERGIEFIDSIQLLPNVSVGDYKYAIINNSVANIRSNPRHSAELATQALLGSSCKVLKIEGSFYLIQVPDGYISWVDHGGVILMTEGEQSKWLESEKLIYTKTVGNVYKEMNNDSDILADIVLGCQLKILNIGTNYYQVEYPDKRVGYIKTDEARVYKDWIQDIEPSGSMIELYSHQLVGSPYLWGGTSTKGMDCSGFTKTVYLMNGFIIPRDASQQIQAGKTIDQNLEFDGLEKGDLMFFGKAATDSTKQRVTHVGIWLGNNKGEFIHSSKQVRLSSIHPESEYYDEGNTKRYLGSRRYLGHKDPMITNLKTDKVLTEIKL